MLIEILIEVQCCYFKNPSETRQNNMFDQERGLDKVREKWLPPCTGAAWLYGALLSIWVMKRLGTV